MTALTVAKQFLLTKLGYRTVNKLLTLKYRKRHESLIEAGARGIIVSGSQRSGTTFLAENIAAATNARLLFEPLAMSVTYSRTRALARSQVLEFSLELDAALTWLLTGDLPYNHSVDAIAEAKHYDRRLLKDLRLGFALKEIAKAQPLVPIIHIVRHPLDSIRSHLKLPIRADHFKLAKNNVLQILKQPTVLRKHPWLVRMDIAKMTVAELELIEWCIENAETAAPGPVENLLVVRYEDVVRTDRLPENIWEFLRNFGIEPNMDKIDLSRPSKTTNTAEIVSLLEGKMVMKYRDFFDQSQIAEARRILAIAGMMRNERESVFGHEII